MIVHSYDSYDQRINSLTNGPLSTARLDCDRLCTFDVWHLLHSGTQQLPYLRLSQDKVGLNNVDLEQQHGYCRSSAISISRRKNKKKFPVLSPSEQNTREIEDLGHHPQRWHNPNPHQWPSANDPASARFASSWLRNDNSWAIKPCHRITTIVRWFSCQKLGHLPIIWWQLFLLQHTSILLRMAW